MNKKHCSRDEELKTMYTFFPQMKYMVFSAASTSPPAFERSLLEAERFAKNGLFDQQM
jgi:hypothetical protein